MQTMRNHIEQTTAVSKSPKNLRALRGFSEQRKRVVLKKLFVVKKQKQLNHEGHGEGRGDYMGVFWIWL